MSLCHSTHTTGQLPRCGQLSVLRGLRQLPQMRHACGKTDKYARESGGTLCQGVRPASTKPRAPFPFPFPALADTGRLHRCRAGLQQLCQPKEVGQVQCLVDEGLLLQDVPRLRCRVRFCAGKRARSSDVHVYIPAFRADEPA